MATAITPPRPEADEDPDGRLRPLNDQEWQARAEALARALADIEAMTDETDTDEVWSDVLRGIDEARPHRPLFDGIH